MSEINRSLIPRPNGYPIKLVRDHTPQIINFSGEPGTLFYRPAKPQEMAELLHKKIGEEVVEYLISKKLNELRDILIAVQGIAEWDHGISLDELIEIAKADERGGFVQGVVMCGHHSEFDGEP